MTTCACHPVDEVARLDKKYKHDIDVVAGLADSLKTTLGMADNIAVVEFIDCVKGKHEPRRIIVPASSMGIQPQQLPNADRPVKPRHARAATLRQLNSGPQFRFSATSVRGVFAKPSADDQDRRTPPVFSNVGTFWSGAWVGTKTRAQQGTEIEAIEDSRQEREIVAHARRPDNADPDPDNMRAHAAPGRLLRPAQFRPVRLRSRLHSLTHRCGCTVRKTVAMPGIILALTTATFVIISLLYYGIPKGFCSTEDNCLITSMAIGPDDASFNAILALPIAL
ncbi:hypothetical protein CCUS01_14123 [Colletotrichum cuscutae]|uniref:Uncharacterized protein n=1 Tax=Colletotrichum cuscutae TaxID=1209917 RepID=A0AAI9Y9Y9_9PEZI|nr:hypothetical protein CCUS01_14123 [Colletotrichum cuscutae]